LIVFLNIDLNVSTNLIDPAHPVQLDAKEIKDRTYGSKTILLVEQCMCAVQWGCKACLLILYWRLTQNLTQAMVVKFTVVYVAFTYCVMVILYFGVWCRPFHEYWAVPTDNSQCNAATNHLITNLVFNLTSDILIMSIPLPLLVKAKIELKRKVLLIFPFSLGFFTIVCAILSKHLSFTQPYSAEWVFWYCRESSTAMLVTNMPYSWALIRRTFNLKSFFGDSRDEQVRVGHMQELQGHSLGNLSAKKLRQESGATNNSTSKKHKLWPFPTSSLKQKSFSTDEGAIIEEGRASATPIDDFKKDVNVDCTPTSNTNSSAGSARKPPNANTHLDAVDKLYRLDYDDLMGPDDDVMRRGYDG
jgi:hypothetical protein